MKIYFNLFPLILILLFFQNSQAVERPNFGLGVVIGNPTAVTALYDIDTLRSLDTALSYASNDYFLIYGDYLIHYQNLFTQKNKFTSQLRPYLGFGAILVATNKDRNDNERYYGKKSGAVGFGIRIPIGAEWKSSEMPIGIFLELAPGVSLAPATDGFFQAGLGIRYYF